ncbi:unnamed protein product [Mucor hiemalis]
MSHMIAKKQEEWNSQKVRELLRLPENKKCFDCPTKSPFFVNVSIQTFLCTRCSGLVREVGHRVKSISASKFSGPEVLALQHGGNEVARSIWLSTYRMSTPEPETDGDVRLFMRQKYYEQKWLDRKRGVEHAENVKRIIKELYSEDGNRKPNTLGRTGSISDKRKSMDIINRPKMAPTQSWVDDNVPIGLIPSVQQQQQQQQNNSNILDDLLLNDDAMISPKSPQFPTIPQLPPTTTSTTNSRNSISGPPTKPTIMTKPQPTSHDTTSINNDIFTELAGLAPPTPVITSPSYSGGILQPNSPISPSSSIHSSFSQSPQQQKQFTFNNTNTNKNSFADLDPYAALRDLSIGSKPVTPTTPKLQNGLKIDKVVDDSLSWGGKIIM